MSSLALLHAIPGRCRLRIPLLRVHPQRRRAIESCLGTHPLVQSFRFTFPCDCVVVEHGGETRAIVTLLRRELGVLDAAGDQGPPSAPAEEPPAPSHSRHAFAWASCALLLSPLPALAPFSWVTLVVCSVPIWQRALRTLLQEHRLNVDFLDGLALAIALLRRQTATGALMAWLVHLGDTIRDRTASHSRREIRALLDFQTVQARRLEADGSVQLIAARDLLPGQGALLLAGDIVPADGVVSTGVAAVDQRHITGESVPATRRIGDVLYAGSSLVEGSVTLRVLHVGDDTAAAKIVQLLEAAPIGETRIQNYAEKFADGLVAPLLGANVALFALSGNVDRFMSLAIVDYGTGIRVAAPTSVLSSMLRAAREGILIKSGRQIEQLAQLRCVAFDKTGTLTRGRLAIVGVRAWSRSLSPDRVLQLAAAAETQLRHPLARALVEASRARGLVLPAGEDVDFSIGLGVSARVGPHQVRVGNERYLSSAGIAMARARRYLRDTETHAQGALLVAVDESLVGAISYADELRPEAAGVIAALRQRGIEDVVMLTGDREGVARRVAASLGIRRYYAEVLPADKADIVRSLRNGAPIAMVGDGVNDSPALAQADVGVALVEGADIARDAADVVLMENNLRHLVDAIDISRDAMALVRQNVTLIAGFNTVALALALPAGWMSPAMSTLLSNGSALAATLNAMRPLMVQRFAPAASRARRL
ncbi:heavy metal translocating P-type ATPase [Aquabacterium sp. A7-Y]|uniref:heavy metal translocating P-type ATPase n=1 Tax=Aquabacterium sp. A7-Y TaxID=1349605 RepID=UPI00223E75DC|nr:heavy metal translocating P-type ATPase [Aquabacterium sp. A7-Y]MCW7538730.1 heavy metal translocating P-type ATPase [Aquabacterium sp. A7-Y]